MKALVFDFDGTIIDSEQAIYDSWQAIFQEHGAHLSVETWLPLIGTFEIPFDPILHLEEQLGRSVDREAVDQKQRELEKKLVGKLAAMPGVEAYIREAKDAGLKLAVASSSSSRWVKGHLDRLGLLESFPIIVTREMVEKTKPDPALFRHAVELLQVEPGDAIAIEDSLHGVVAAKGAGLWALAVPGGLTRGLDFSPADLRVESLADLSLVDLLSYARKTSKAYGSGYGQGLPSSSK